MDNNEAKMNHYEIIFMVNADHSEQVSELIARYRKLIEENKGTIHRLEDWGRRQLAYPINKAHKAHYVLMNLEITKSVLEELNSMFKLNDKVIRTLVLKREQAITSTSPMMEQEAESKETRTSNNTVSEDTKA